MKLFHQLGAVLWAWRGVSVAVRDLAVWSPLLLLTLLRVLSLMFLLFFHFPALVPVAAPVVEFLGGEGATHYPHHLHRLPAMFASVDLVLTLTVGALATGVLTTRFAAVFESGRARGGWATALTALPSLFLFSALVAATDPAIVAMTDVLPERLSAHPLLPALLLAGRVGAQLLVQVLLAYAVAAVMVERASFPRALLTSVRLALELPVVTVLLVVLPAGVVVVFDLAMRTTDFSRLDTNPEFIATILACQILVGLFSDLVRIGAVTRVFVWKSGEKR